MSRSKRFLQAVDHEPNRAATSARRIHDRPRQVDGSCAKSYPHDSHIPQAEGARFRLARLGKTSQKGLSRPVSGASETEWFSWSRPPRKRRAFARMVVRRSVGTGKLRKKREAQAEPTFFSRPAAPGLRVRSSEGNSRGSDVSRDPRSGVQRGRKISVGNRLGNRANRKASPGTQGTDRGRKAPAGTFLGGPSPSPARAAFLESGGWWRHQLPFSLAPVSPSHHARLRPCAPCRHEPRWRGLNPPARAGATGA